VLIAQSEQLTSQLRVCVLLLVVGDTAALEQSALRNPVVSDGGSGGGQSAVGSGQCGQWAPNDGFSRSCCGETRPRTTPSTPTTKGREGYSTEAAGDVTTPRRDSKLTNERTTFCRFPLSVVSFLRRNATQHTRAPPRHRHRASPGQVRLTDRPLTDRPKQHTMLTTTNERNLRPPPSHPASSTHNPQPNPQPTTHDPQPTTHNPQPTTQADESEEGRARAVGEEYPPTQPTVVQLPRQLRRQLETALR